MRKKKPSPLFRKILNEISGAKHVNLEKPKKSKFQQRLEEMQKKHRENSPGAATAGKVKRHKPGLPREAMAEQNQTAQIPGDWISVLDELPPYYTSVDIYNGLHIMEDWARVSHGGERDGKDDFYVNNRDNNVVYDITYWRKRPYVSYVSYDPMTKDDKPKYTQRDIDGIIINLNNLTAKHTQRDDEHSAGYTQGVDEAIDTIKYHTNETRRCKTGG